MADGDQDDLFSRLKAILFAAQTDEQGNIRLPPERVLAESLDVQRSTVRERLATLESLGFLRRTQGSGTYLQMPSPGFLQLYFELASRLGFISIDDMEQAREMLEREIVRMAALRATDEDVERLSALRDKILNAGSITGEMKADHEFHMCLAYVARNPVIILLVQGLSTVLKQLVHRRRVLVRKEPDASKRTNATHIAIVEAIRARDPDQAIRAMDQHFRTWNEEFSRISMGDSQGLAPEHQGSAADS